MTKKLLIVLLAVGIVGNGIVKAELNAPKKDELPKNVVKLNLFSLALTNISLQYERQLNRNFSAGLGFSTLVPRSLPKAFTSGSEFASANFGGWAVTPELRFYTGKNDVNDAPKGFYLAPYMRIANYRLKLDYDYVDNGKVTSYSATGRYKGTGFGLMFGYQWIISNRVSIDWWMLGIHGGAGKIQLEMVDDFRNNKESLTRDLNTSFSGAGVEVKVTDTKATVAVPIPYFGIRSGLTIGIGF
jgi:hypothetical protein